MSLFLFAVSMPTRNIKPTIVVEGPDGSGKTTLANTLCEYLGLEYKHLTYIEKPEDMYEQFREAEDLMFKGGILLDRYIMSNKVYAKATGDKEVYESNRFWYNMSVLIQSGRVYHITCLPAPKDFYISEFRRLCKERDELYTSETLMSKVYDIYLDMHDLLVQDSNGSRYCMTYNRNPQLQWLYDHWPTDVAITEALVKKNSAPASETSE